MLIGAPLVVNVGCQEPPPVDHGPTTFKDIIDSFHDWDAKNSLPDSLILFVGSSSIRLWTTAEDFPQLGVVNRGFGGSQMSDVLYWFDDVVGKYRARKIVLYEGDNDINAGESPEQFASELDEFLDRVWSISPETEVVFLSIKPSESRWAHWPAMQAANRAVQQRAEREPRLTYVDVATPLLDSDGQPRTDLFHEDALHLNRAGYDVWKEIVTPELK